MNISNFTQLYNIIKESGLQNSPPLDNFIMNVDQYASICECTAPQQKKAKLTDVKDMYYRIISGFISSYASTIKSKKGVEKIHCYDQGRLISSY